jgi:CheY-like chemotaxis protein/HPt (histidine-containing phosphotransfer) domain-containing protein
VTVSQSKPLLDDAENLLTTIRGGVLVHLQDGVYPEHLRIPLDLARSLSECVAEIGDATIADSAETLEAWLALLVSETNAISHTRTRSLLDQISELEVELLAFRANANSSFVNVGDFVDESFRSLDPTKPPDDPGANTEESFDIDSEMLEVFRDEAAGLLENIRTNLETLSHRPDDSHALWEIKRNAHTLKGAAGIVGLNKLSTLAHRVEDLLGRISESDDTSKTDIFDLLRSAALCMTSLADGSTSGELDRQIVSLHRRFAAAMRAIASAADDRPAAADESDLSRPVETPAPNAVREPSEHKDRIVRVSLDRLDDLVTIVRGLKSTRHAFEQSVEEFQKQIEEADNNKLRLQAASGKLEGIGPRRTSEIDLSLPDFGQLKYEIAETAHDTSVINVAMMAVKNGLDELYEHHQRLIGSVHERLMRLRNVEFGSIATRLQRTVRVTCDEENKRAEIEIVNGSFEVDTHVIHLLLEPLMHLLKNAVVHGIEYPETRRMLGKAETGKITVHVRNEGSSVLVSVADDGRGIAHQALVDKAIAAKRIERDEADRMSAAQVQDLIFLAGFTTAEKLSLNAGRGVGMNIVRESLAAAGGSISIETWPQRGTTFTIRVPNPFAPIAEETASVSPLPKEERSDLTVLVVDDSPSVRLITGRTIRAAGWNVETARNGVDALNKLMSMDDLPHLILSDVEMPLMGGYELLAALRSEPTLKYIPIVIVSSRAGAEDRKRALAAGSLDYVTKPYDEGYLIELIDRLALRPELQTAS